MTQARLGWGTLIQCATTAPDTDGVYQDTHITVTEAQSISGPNLSADDIDVTNHDSEGGFREFIAGLKEGGTCTFSGNFVPDDVTHARLIDDQKDGTRRNWQIVLPDRPAIGDRSVIDFTGYVQACGFEFPTDSQMTYNATVKIAGEPDITPAS